jgi:hypothetical protein
LREACQGANEQDGDVNVATSANTPKDTIEVSQFFKVFAEEETTATVEYFDDEIAYHEATADPQETMFAGRGCQIGRDGQIPRLLHEKVEHMFQFTQPRKL